MSWTSRSLTRTTGISTYPVPLPLGQWAEHPACLGEPIGAERHLDRSQAQMLTGVDDLDTRGDRPDPVGNHEGHVDRFQRETGRLGVERRQPDGVADERAEHVGVPGQPVPGMGPHGVR